MKIRHATAEDARALKAIHAQMGIDYQLPELEKMASAIVFEDDSGTVRMAILLRPTVEAYMLVDREDKVSARERWSRFLCIHKAALQDAAAKGIEDGYAFPPPHLDKSFGRKLKRLGWFRPWPAWNKIVKKEDNPDENL
ncbi:MAG TPA: hypothetical protein VK738_04295 [Terriglobales bacterium]|jgi:hypothetical protein|nr:hypothetical protein [Terriglobales bacterium]